MTWSRLKFWILLWVNGGGSWWWWLVLEYLVGQWWRVSVVVSATRYGWSARVSISPLSTQRRSLILCVPEDSHGAGWKKLASELLAIMTLAAQERRACFLGEIVGSGVGVSITIAIGRSFMDVVKGNSLGVAHVEGDLRGGQVIIVVDVGEDCWDFLSGELEKIRDWVGISRLVNGGCSVCG